MSNKNPLKVPMSDSDLTDLERQAVMDVLESKRLSLGPEIAAFEQAVQEYIGVKHAIAVNSGTAGLHLCIRAAGIEMDDLVITTPFSFMSSSNVILFEKAVPVFVDVDPVTGNIDPNLVAQAAADLAAGGESAKKWLPRKGASPDAKLKALLPVDVFGQPADFEPLRQTADQHGLVMIEDSCEAIGAQYQGRMAGTLGDMGVFAFYPNKQMTTGEGGIIITDDDEAADLMRALRNQGRGMGDNWLQHTYLGYNYRTTDMSAALGRVQIGRLDELLENRKRVASWYAQHLEGLSVVEQLQIAPDTTKMSWFVYVVRLSAEIDRDEVMQKLAAEGIPSRPYFGPIHLQPFMVEQFGYQAGDFPITEDLGRRGLALPFSSVMTEEMVEMVCEALGKVLSV